MTMKARFLIALLAPVAASCATMPPSPIVESDRDTASRGEAVGFNQPVWVSQGLIVTPLRLIEDSRCPADAQCVWQGRVRLETQLHGIGWRQTVELQLDQPYTVRGQTVRLAAVEPQKRTDRAIAVGDYRFRFGGAD